MRACDEVKRFENCKRHDDNWLQQGSRSWSTKEHHSTERICSVHLLRI